MAKSLERGFVILVPIGFAHRKGLVGIAVVKGPRKGQNVFDLHRVAEQVSH